MTALNGGTLPSAIDFSNLLTYVHMCDYTGASAPEPDVQSFGGGSNGPGGYLINNNPISVAGPTGLQNCLINPGIIQVHPSGTNAVTSNSITTTNNDLCIAGTSDSQFNAGTLTTGTNIAWVTGANDATAPTNNETFAQTSPGAITGTFTYSSTLGTFQTGMSCYKP